MSGIEAMLLIALKPESNHLRQLYLRGNLASSRIGSELQARSCARTHTCSFPDILPSFRSSVLWTDLQTVCVVCLSSGKWTNIPTSISFFRCAPAIGATDVTACSPCPASYPVNTTTLPGAINSSMCFCPPGYKVPGRGPCTPCPATTFK